VWPAAKPFSIPASFPDGSTYVPQFIVDPAYSIGLTTSADAQNTALVAVSGNGPPRILDSRSVNDGGSFDGITVTPAAIYWMRTTEDSAGHGHVALWTADRSAGKPRQLTTDVGTPLFDGSGYDTQVANGRLYWTGSADPAGDRTELRSIPLSGGPVRVETLAGAWTMTAWPWLVTAPSASAQPTRLHNLTTGATLTATVPAHQQVSCQPAWCRMIPVNAANGGQNELIKPDGSDRQPIGGPDAVAIDSDVALCDRFEALTTTVSSNQTTTVSRLDLYDIARKRTVLIEPASTNAGARGAYLWWSTGDAETLAWHGLNLTTLP
jgi:hypothetical protein